MRIRNLVVAAVLATAAVPALAQSTGFTSYAAVGDSLTAGFSSGALVESHQRNSYPALIARQAGLAGFEQPWVTEPGIPAELALVQLVPTTVIAPKSSLLGAPRNLALARPYNNLAVPGATVIDAYTDSGVSRVPPASFILRGLGTQVQQASALRPGLITLWIGNNDVLGAVIRGTAVEGLTITPRATFRQYYAAVLEDLTRSGARIVAANLPDATTIPFATTIPPVVVNPATRQPVLVNGQTVPLLGPNGPLASNTLVTLGASSLLAQGIGIPKALGGTNTPLPNEVLLDANEVAVIRDVTAANNSAIRDLCAAKSIPVLDANAILRDFAAGNRSVGGIDLDSGFLTGGIFSYDGVHPGDLGYAVLTNEWIRLINTQVAAGSLPEVDLNPYLFRSTANAGPRGGFEFTREAWEQLLAAFPTVDGR